jgi:hypothetical protein
MTNEEKLLARLKTLDASSLYEIVVYVTADKTVGFWVVTKTGKAEGENSSTIAKNENLTANPV